MKIAIVLEAFPSLSETFISNKVKHLSLRGHSVFVFCNTVNEVLLRELLKDADHLKVISFHKTNILLYSILHPFSVIRCARAQGSFRQNIFRKFRTDLINKVSPDIIHFGFSGVALAYLHSIDELKGKKVVSCRGTAENVNLLVSKQRQMNLQKLFDKVDAIHCVSSALRDTVLPYCRQPEKFFINNSSVDPAIFKRTVACRATAPLIILSVGRFIFQKGYVIGLLAMKKLRQSNRNFKWLIAGSGTQYEELTLHIHQLELQNDVVLLGNKNRNEIIDLYQQAAVFFLPSVTEGIANVVLEAMSMELPVVSTRCGGMEEVITHGENGLLSDSYDADSLAENLRLLLDDAELRRRLGKCARKKIVEKFTLQKQIDKFENIYQQLLNNNYPVKKEMLRYDGHDERKVNLPNALTKSQKRLRIGVIVPQFPSYTETFFINQITGLCERNHKVFVFCNVYNNDALLKEVYNIGHYQSLKIVALHFNKLGEMFFRTIFLNPLSVLKSLRLSRKKFLNNLYYHLCRIYLRKYQCDIYHFGYSGLAVSYLSILSSLPGKVIISCLGTAENIKPLTEEGRIEKLKKLFATVDAIHCVSGKMKQTIQQYDAPPEKIFINRPAVDVEIFRRKEPYTMHQPVKIISVGRLVFQKGFLLGILAVAELKKKFEDFTWTIVGDGPEREQLLFHINALGLNDHVILAGKKIRDELVQFYEESDLLLLPSVSEGIANVILEAMAMELPVISTINGGVEEVVKHEVNGILIPNYDFQLVACGLHQLCTDFEMRKRLGQAGRKTVEDGFALKRYIDVFEEEYLRVVQN